MSDTPTPELDILEPGEEAAELQDGATVPLIAIKKTDDGADSLIAVEGIIRRQSARLDELKEQLKLLNEQLHSVMDNDEELTNADEAVKAATRKVKERKVTLANTSESIQLKFKIKEAKESAKDLEESLSNHLLSLYQITGTKEFDTDDGSKREFDVKAKLRGKKKQD